MLRRSAVICGEAMSDNLMIAIADSKNSEIAKVQLGALALSGLTPELSRAAAAG